MISGETIRQALREATAAAHARLDASAGSLDFGQPEEYAAFLRLQLDARTRIEDWAALYCPFELQPPPQTALISADLAELGYESNEASAIERFSAPIDGALGVAWALGGSSLGNRAMLAGLRKRGLDLPVRFLTDDAMPTFFARLRRQFEQPAGAYPQLASAIAAAHAVFATFASASDRAPLKRAA